MVSLAVLLLKKGKIANGSILKRKGGKDSREKWIQ
jgi:hypothetical protein